MKKVLFVCTANLQRSPTAEKLFDGWKGKWVAKSAGVEPDPGGTPLSQELIDWADVVIAMEAVNGDYVRANFQRSFEKTVVLGVRDRYFRDDPELVNELKKKVPPILERSDHSTQVNSG